MTVKRLPVGPIGTNCYLFTDEGGHGGVVDPGAEAPRILALARELDVTIDGIFLTHGHFDHTGAVEVLCRALRCPVYLHPADRAMLGSEIMPAIGPTADYNDGDTIAVGGLTLQVLHTPGHTPGGVCLAVGDALFTGDTLFRGSMGRTDLPGGGYEVLMASLRRLGGLSGDYRVLPGHEGTSTLEAERSTNPFLMEAMGLPL